MAVDEAVLSRTVERFRERRILLPTFAQMRDPSAAPEPIKRRLNDVGMWDVDPANLFRITWKNEPLERGGLFNDGNWIEFPSALTGVDARIVGLVGKWFPTGAHKVGAAFGCLVPKLVSGQFDPTRHKAVWPSTGNFCRGGAFDSALVGCTAVAILPEEMSRERFAWLEKIGAEVIPTPGCESNVKEIYDKCWEIRRTRPDCVIFNQFEEFGNAVWHYHVTGTTIDEVFRGLDEPSPSPARLSSPQASLRGRGNSLRLAACVFATGSAGTIAAGDFLRTMHPQIRVVAAEALQCPTLYQFGFGGHRIEGIGDKHVPWIHNVRNTDAVAAVDDAQCLALFRLFNEPVGQTHLNHTVPDEVIQKLPLMGISGICNLVAAIKAAKYYELDSRDVVFTVLTDSADMYASRLEELAAEHGPYTPEKAAYDKARYLDAIAVDHVRELTYHDRKALHNFKYFTWVEQQGRTAQELRELWEPEFWERTFAQVEEWDQQIIEFNERTGVLELL
jgi:cysteine synthase